MDTWTRVDKYTMQNKGARLTHAQRRRVVKKGGNQGVPVQREEGMGYPAAYQGWRSLDMDPEARPETVQVTEVWIDEVSGDRP